MNIDYQTPLRRAVLSAALLAAALATPAHAQTPPGAVDPATLARIRDTAMASDWAYQRLSDLTDLIGPRLSGSAGAAAAVTQTAQALRSAGLAVTLEPVRVPHWVRGVESAELTDYAGRPAGLSQRVVLTALGGSGATPAAGLNAPLLVVHSMDELAARAKEVPGRIVLFDVAYDQNLADAGLSGVAYGQAGLYRFAGPQAAARLGAVAALVRSVGGADYRIAHTGATRFADGSQIPAAAVTAEDAMLITRLDARGPVRMHLTLTPQTLPDADSYNVIGEIRGSEKPDEIVVVSGHLDSWDLATGAIDDGAGVVGAMGALEVLKRLNLQPKRTIRVVAWMNEENGSRGGKTYTVENLARVDKHVAAIESDSGAGRPLGLMASVRPEAAGLFKPLQAALLPLGAAAFTRRDALGTGDLTEIENAGVPIFEPLLDNRTYFNYHHTPADTLDKVVPENLRRQVALLGMLSWYLANMPEAIGRAPGLKKN